MSLEMVELEEERVYCRYQSLDHSFVDRIKASLIRWMS